MGVRRAVRPQDDLYVEIEYHPNAFYMDERWSVILRSDDPTNHSVGGRTSASFEWLARRRGRRLIAKKRRERVLLQRAREYGRKVIR